MHQTSSESRFFNAKIQYFSGTLACNVAVDVNRPLQAFFNWITREGEAPAEPLHHWLGRNLALPKVFNGIDFAKMLTAVASLSHSFKSELA